MLIGMMGAGKTTVGKAVAGRLGWMFYDSDAQVEARTGRTVNEIWSTDGEASFRHLEAEALADALAATAEHPAVIAAAGGVVLDARNRKILQRHPPVVWLRARPETLVTRVGTGRSHRPLLADDPAGALVALNAVRQPYYQEVADAVVDVDDLPAVEVIERVIEAAGLRGPNAATALRDPNAGDSLRGPEAGDIG